MQTVIPITSSLSACTAFSQTGTHIISILRLLSRSTSALLITQTMRTYPRVQAFSYCNLHPDRVKKSDVTDPYKNESVLSYVQNHMSRRLPYNSFINFARQSTGAGTLYFSIPQHPISSDSLRHGIGRCQCVCIWRRLALFFKLCMKICVVCGRL